MKRRLHWQNVRWILSRELRDQLRDRRTLFVILVLPVLLYPLMGVAFFQVSQFMQERTTKVLVVGARDLEGLPTLLENNQFAEALFSAPNQAHKSRLLEVHFNRDEPRAGAAPLDPEIAARVAVETDEYRAAVVFPPDFAARVRAFREALQHRILRGEAKDPGPTDAGLLPQPPSPKIFYTSANEQSQLAYMRLLDVLERWTEEIVKGNLKASGVPARAAKPFVLEKADVAAQTSLQGAAIWSKILPMLLLIWAMTGAFYPAVDLCAGEKERGTLETLLSSPAERSEIVLGKLLTIMFFSMLTAGLNLVSMAVMGGLILAKMPGLGPPPLLAIVWLPLAMVPIAALFSALCLALAAFARSTKEGQYYLMPLLLITMPLAVLPMASGVELSLGNSLIPVAGLILLLRSALEGNYLQVVQFTPPVVVVTLGCCYLAIRWAVDQFNSESVLFRESERLDVGLWLRHLLAERRPTPTVALAVFCGVLILVVNFFLSVALPESKVQGFSRLALLTLVTQVTVIALPVIVLTLIFTGSPRKTLLLRWPSLGALLGAAVLAVVIHPATMALNQVVTALYPINGQMLGSLGEVEQMLRAAPAWAIVLVFALTPAVCEELAFRGFVLSGFRHLGYKWRAIVFSAVFFGLTHTILQQSLIAALVGTVIGLIAVQSGSILPGMVFHLIHNSLALLTSHVPSNAMQRMTWLRYLLMPGEESSLVYGMIVAISAAVSLALIVWFNRRRYVRSPEEQQQEAIRQAWQTEA